MSRMNEALNRGETIVQGNRLVESLTERSSLQWYAIYWSCYTYLFPTRVKSSGLSAFLTGTGFAVKGNSPELRLAYFDHHRRRRVCFPAVPEARPRLILRRRRLL